MKHQSFDSSPLAWSSFLGKPATTDLSGEGGGGQGCFHIFVAFMYVCCICIKCSNMDTIILLGAAFAHL